MPTIAIDIPARIHTVPDHEAALSIDEVPVDPGVFSSGGADTRSVSVSTRRPVTTRDTGSRDIDTASSVVPLPAAERSAMREPARRDRARALASTLVRSMTFGRVRVGGSTVAARSEVDLRIRTEFVGGTRFVPVLTRKGGVGKTTVTALLGMALADVRGDRIVAVDANPDRGTLAERIERQTRSTVRDVVVAARTVSGIDDLTRLLSRDETGLDILASDTDPLVSEAFDENDYNVVADLCSRYYSLVLTDCGTGIVHSVMRATLLRADSVVVVSGGSIDEARLASETLTWLEANGHGSLVRNAVVAVNAATHGTDRVRLDEIEDHFRSRVRAVVRIPYDPQLAAGSVVRYSELRSLTRNAARELAAAVVDGLPASRDS